MKQGGVALLEVAGSISVDWVQPPLPSPLPRAGSGFWIHTKVAGERVQCWGPGPRAAVALLLCPGLPSLCPSGAENLGARGAELSGDIYRQPPEGAPTSVVAPSFPLLLRGTS